MITWRRIPTLKTTLMKYLSQLKCLSVSVMAGYRFVIRQDLKPEIEPNLGWNVVFSKGVSIFTGILTFSMTPSQSNLPGCCAWANGSQSPIWWQCCWGREQQPGLTDWPVCVGGEQAASSRLSKYGMILGRYCEWIRDLNKWISGLCCHAVVNLARLTI